MNILVSSPLPPPKKKKKEKQKGGGGMKKDPVMGRLLYQWYLFSEINYCNSVMI